LRDVIAREVCYVGCYEPPESALVLSLLEPGATFIDVGANWGYFTLIAASAIGPSGRVISLEPDPRLLPILRENLAENGFDNVTALALAAHETDGEAALVGYREGEGNFGVSRLAPAASSERSFAVKTRTLDSLLRELRIPNVDLLKMDIEGGEGFALRGLARSLASGVVRRVLVELHPDHLAAHGETVESAVQPLVDAGLDPWVVDHSPAAYRGAMKQRHNIGRLLARWDRRGPLGAWPHLLWTMANERPVP
jgi:FkbM family methyltransferase